MLRLWPETVHLSLFPGVAWMTRNGVASEAVDTASDADTVAQLRTLLAATAAPLRTGTRVVLTVSDSLARVVAMQWQRDVQSLAEVDAYAHACLQHAGIALGDGWTMHAQFRDMDAMGLAYALPDALLSVVAAELAERRLVLSTVLPLSASLYFGVRPRRGGWPAVLVATERARHIACVFGPAGMIGYDVEAIVGSPAASAQRLERRLAVRHGAALRRAVWCADAQTRDGSMGHQAWVTVA